MILCIEENNLLRFDTPEQVLKMDYLLVEKTKLADQDGNLVFIVPKKFITNDEKIIYKSGFLMIFLKLLYPEKTIDQICEIINSRYQLFKGRRQLERNLKKFQSEIDFYVN